MKYLLFFILFLCFACSSTEKDITVSETNNILDQVQNNKTCKLPSGQIVEDGWAGKDTGINYCNECSCENGVFSCTEMACELQKDSAVNKDNKTCKLSRCFKNIRGKSWKIN